MIDEEASLTLLDYHSLFDELIFRWINRHHSPNLDGVMMGLSSRRMGIVAVVVLLLLVLWRVARTRSTGADHATLFLGITCSLALSDVVGARIMKPAAARMRPCFALSDVRTLSAQAHSSALPSLHAANAMALAVVVLLTSAKHRRFGISLTLAAFAIGYSRVLLWLGEEACRF